VHSAYVFIFLIISKMHMLCLEVGIGDTYKCIYKLILDLWSTDLVSGHINFVVCYQPTLVLFSFKLSAKCCAQ